MGSSVVSLIIKQHWLRQFYFGTLLGLLILYNFPMNHHVRQTLLSEKIKGKKQKDLSSGTRVLCIDQTTEELLAAPENATVSKKPNIKLCQISSSEVEGKLALSRSTRPQNFKDSALIPECRIRNF